MFKKKNQKTKLTINTLSENEMHNISGGLACTCGTYSVCHIDGTTDCDCAFMQE